jgi:hypothetical protein
VDSLYESFQYEAVSVAWSWEVLVAFLVSLSTLANHTLILSSLQI